MASGTLAQHMFAQNPGRAVLARWPEAAMQRAGGEARGGRPNASEGPSLITIDPADWVDPDEVDARDVRDPMLLASLVLVASHLAERCTVASHSADCRSALAAMGHATFDDLLAGLGIDIHAKAGFLRVRHDDEGRRR